MGGEFSGAAALRSSGPIPQGSRGPLLAAKNGAQGLGHRGQLGALSEPTEGSAHQAHLAMQKAYLLLWGGGRPLEREGCGAQGALGAMPGEWGPGTPPPCV